MLWTYCVTVLILVITSLYYYFTRTFNYWKKRKINGPKPIPFFGNIKESALRRKNLGIVFREIYNEYPEEKLVGVYRMTTPTLLIRDLDMVKQLLITDFDVFVDRGIQFSTEGLGMNLVHVDGDHWRVLRKRLTPLFTNTQLKNMINLLNERGDRFVEYISKLTQDDSREFEAYSLMQNYTTSTISACAFGLDIDFGSELMEKLKNIGEEMFTASFADELDMMYNGLLKKLNVSIFAKWLTKFFFDLVKNVFEQRNHMPSSRNDFIDLLLELKREGEIHGNKRHGLDHQIHLEITESIIVAQVFIFFAGAYETGAATLSHFLYEMAKNPDVQDQVISEVDRVLSRHNGLITLDTLKEMEYLEKAFEETLRKYPVGDPIIRVTNRDYKIPGTDVVIEKDLRVAASAHGIHNDEKYYPEPDKFDPERFSPENVRSRHVCAYFPFGIGPRNCIGMRFAKAQVKICMAKIMNNFRVEVSRNTPSKIAFDGCKRPVVAPHGVYITLVKRK